MGGSASEVGGQVLNPGGFMNPLLDRVGNLQGTGLRPKADSWTGSSLNNYGGLGGGPVGGPGGIQMPEYQSMTYGDSGILKPAYHIQLDKGPELSTMGLDQLRNMATTPSSQSEWLKTQQAALGATTDDAVKQSALSRLQASNAATAGGAERGVRGMSRVRLGELTQNNVNDTAAIRRQSMVSGANLASSAEQQRMNAIGMLPGAELAAANYGRQGANIGNTQEQLNSALSVMNAQGLSDFDMRRYSEQMGALGAEKTADATRNSGKK